MFDRAIYFRVILWLTLAIFVGWLLWQGAAPTGKISYVYDFKAPDHFIQKLTPAERVSPAQDGRQVVSGDPVYFALRTQRTFDTAKLTVKFKNPDGFPLLEAGALADKQVWRYKLRPLDNQLLDRLENKWRVVREGELALYQRGERYRSVGEFLQSPPPSEQIGLYNYDLRTDFIIDGYRAATATAEYRVPLRGAYQFYTYLEDESLDFTFSFRDLNQNKDADPIKVALYQGERLVRAADLPDDGIAADNNQAGALRTLEIRQEGLEAGAYKVELTVNDDIVTENIKTRQQKLAFVNRLWLADSQNKNFKLYTDSRGINVQTINPASLQKILVAGKAINLNETYRQFGTSLGGNVNEMIIAKPDIIISGDGVFASSIEALLNPGPVKLGPATDLDRQGINYVLARYSPPRQEDDWQVATAEFDLKNAYREFYKYNFMLSIPGLKAEDKSGKRVEIDEIRVDLHGTSLLEKIKRLSR